MYDKPDNMRTLQETADAWGLAKVSVNKLVERTGSRAQYVTHGADAMFGWSLHKINQRNSNPV